MRGPWSFHRGGRKLLLLAVAKPGPTLKGRGMRIPLALIVATSAALVLPALAGADKPVKEPVPFDPVVLEGPCPFPILAEATKNKEKARIFSSGIVSITGKLFVRLTNTDNGESVELNISGPVRITPQADGTVETVLRGRSAIFLFPTDAGGPAFLLTSGRVALVSDEEGNVLSFTHTGKSTDICAILS